MIKANILPNGEIIADSNVVSDSINFDTIDFTFPPSWDGLSKTVVFSNAGKTVNVILDDTNSCYIPYEVNFEPEFTVSVFGIRDGVRATTARGKIKVLESGYKLGDAPQDPTPTEYEQIVLLMNETKQIAQSVRNDADSGVLKGEKGDMGPQGEKGEPFKYSDFTAEQLENLRGPQGEIGKTGPKGEKGEPFVYSDFTVEQLENLRGLQGEIGKTGPKGEKGEPFVYSDFTAEQLGNLRGPKGEKGDTGPQGENYILTDADKQEIAGMVEVGNTPTSDNWCVIANTTLTENIGSEKAQQKFFEVTTDINGNPLAEKNIRHLRMTFYFPTSEDALYHGFQVSMSTKGLSVVNTKCADDSYFGCQVDVMNENEAFVVRPTGTAKSYNENNFVLAGAHFQERSGLFGGKDKIEGIYFYTNYPNGTILPVGTKIMITGW